LWLVLEDGTCSGFAKLFFFSLSFFDECFLKDMDFSFPHILNALLSSFIFFFQCKPKFLENSEVKIRYVEKAML